MDKRTEYRVVQIPEERGRWIAEYRRWWSPFWATHCELFHIYPPTTWPKYFDEQWKAEAWCVSHARKEAERDRTRALPFVTVRLGRLP